MHCTFQTDEYIYIVMDYVNGYTLFSMIRSKLIHFDEEKVKYIAASMVLGLDALHVKKIVHRDLKPGNIIVDSKG